MSAFALIARCPFKPCTALAYSVHIRFWIHETILLCNQCVLNRQDPIRDREPYTPPIPSAAENNLDQYVVPNYDALSEPCMEALVSLHAQMDIEYWARIRLLIEPLSTGKKILMLKLRSVLMALHIAKIVRHVWREQLPERALSLMKAQDNQECPICYNAYASDGGVHQPIQLGCNGSHIVGLACFEQLLKTWAERAGEARPGVQGPKCPFDREILFDANLVLHPPISRSPTCPFWLEDLCGSFDPSEIRGTRPVGILVDPDGSISTNWAIML
ncbi:hypothetical protein B0O99DRAFT_598969 [Bisporella sp. PMI_857]|nr:hypothetical protein B0O99DRAFT_598969 [Bisporella sp. PMI_857]